MNSKNILSKFRKAGAIISTIQLTEKTQRISAKFPSGKVCTFDPDWETGKVSAIAIPYGYDDANQSETCFFRYSIKSALALTGVLENTNPVPGQVYEFFSDCENEKSRLTVIDVTPDHVYYQLAGSRYVYPMIRWLWDSNPDKRVLVVTE